MSRGPPSSKGLVGFSASMASGSSSGAATYARGRWEDGPHHSQRHRRDTMRRARDFVDLDSRADEFTRTRDTSRDAAQLCPPTQSSPGV